ncbi:hypothetical protein ACNANV_11145 [Curtobacterium flaccumfaciens pv. flaccumfaciens]|uniref:hypothetical protein n=1 Tax=Curtobacterium flaccumfaciens TaxID=2035 RepID=UPI003A4E1117
MDSPRPEEPRFRRHLGAANAGVVPPPLRGGAVAPSARLEVGEPFVLGPDGTFDVGLHRALGDVRFLEMGASTRVDYADDLVAFLNFLWFSRGRKNWKSSNTDDREAYFKFRNIDRNGPLVAPSTWNREVASVSLFYQIAISRGIVEGTEAGGLFGIDETVRRPHWALALRQAYRPNGHPEAFDFIGVADYYSWRDVGLRGTPGAVASGKRYRGRHTSRNRLFTDLLVRTGLRLREASSLLVLDLPKLHAESVESGTHAKCYLPVGIAKNQSARVFWVPLRLWDELRGYARFGRKAAIARARSRGAYGAVAPRFVADSRSAKTVTDSSGRRHAIKTLSAAQRKEVWLRTADGLEPAWLWLTESGFPMTASGWQGVFVAANRRVAKAGGMTRCHPHLLRHLYATTQLLQLRRLNRLRTTMGLPQVGDPLTIVRIRMGHRSVATTVRYLHAVQDDEGASVGAIPDDWEQVAELEKDEVG